MTDVNFVHESGDVVLRDVNVRIADGSASITGLVSTDVWEHIEREGVFGTNARRRAGALVGSGDVKIEISGPESALTPGAGPFARDWSITAAMRRLQDAPGEVWTGASFTDPPMWQRAAEALDELGFTRTSETDTSVRYADSSGTEVTASADTESRLGGITCRRSIGTASGSSPSELLVAVNHVNDTFPAGTLSYADGAITLKSGVPIPEGVDVSEILEALAYGLPGMVDMVAPTLGRVASGEISGTDAIQQIFG